MGRKAHKPCGRAWYNGITKKAEAHYTKEVSGFER